MGKTKVYGKANDTGVTEEEFAVAKLVQNAKGNGLGWTKNVLYRDKYGKHQDAFIPNSTVRACAVGAKRLVPDTYEIEVNTLPNDEGNYGSLRVGELVDSADLISLGYRLAMR